MIELKNFNILFVEDDLEIQNNMYKILSLICNRVFLASNGLEALELFNTNNIDIIITDYEMPKMNGYQLVLAIRELNDNIPIIILSNYIDSEKLLKCIPLKLTSYLEKPIIFEELIKVLRNCQKHIEQFLNFEYKIDNDLIYSFKTKSISKNGRVIKLTAFEVDILEYLLDKRNQIVQKDILLYILNKENSYDDISLKNIIYRLKKKTKQDLIINQKNIGYMLVCK